MFVVDEAAHVPIVNLKEIPGVGRGRKFGVMLFYQNLSQGYDMYGEHGFNAILGSINTKTFLPGCDLVTARYASELVGQTTVWGHSYDDAPGTQYDKTRTTEAARPLVDPAEIRQLPLHRQAVTTVETMPPVKWTYPRSVKTGARSLPRTYGTPRIVNFLEAERATKERRLSEASGERAAPVVNAPAPAISDAGSRQGETTARIASAAPLEAVATTHEDARQTHTDEAAAEQIIKEKTREAIGNLFAGVDGSASTLPMSAVSAATALEKVLNP
jgi:TraM recognition site of TraD and TraG